MTFKSLNEKGKVTDEWTVYSVGGGALAEEGHDKGSTPEIYDMNRMSEILYWCERTGRNYWEYVQQCEDEDIWDYLAEVWKTMREAIERGLDQEGVLPGPLNLRRKASTYYIKAKGYKDNLRSRGLVFSYALAVSENSPFICHFSFFIQRFESHSIGMKRIEDMGFPDNFCRRMRLQCI